MLSQSVTQLCHCNMKNTAYILAAIVLLILSAPSVWALEHNITAVAVTSPLSAGRYAVNLQNPVTVDFRNNGTQNDSNVALTVVIRNSSGVSVYRDTQVVDVFEAGQTKEVSFLPFTPTSLSPYQVCGIAVLPTDEDRSDDTACATMRIAYEADAKAVSVTLPTPDGTIPAKLGFRAKGFFSSPGIRELYDVKARMQIRNCSNNALVIQIDSTIPELIYDDGNVPFEFPSRNATYDTRKLNPGCYKIALIVTLPDDGDRTNDTAYANFEVIDTVLTHDMRTRFIITPPSGYTSKTPTVIPFHIQFSNEGASTEENVNVAVFVANPKGTIIFRDTAQIASIPKGNRPSVSFKDLNFTSQSNYYGNYTVMGVTMLGTDMYPFNDTLRSTMTLGSEQDIETVEILDPYLNEVKPGGFGFGVKATFRTKWLSGEIKNVPVRVQIYECRDHQLRFQADTVTPLLTVDTGLFTVIFPVKTGTFNTASLPAGCYDVRVFNRLSFDGNRKDDTATSHFTIAPFRAHNITASTVTAPLDMSHGGKLIAVAVKYQNTGVNDESSVKLLAVIKDRDGNVIYRDSAYEYNWISSEERTKGFKNFTLPADGVYTLYGICSMAGDVFPPDDTVLSHFSTGQVIDAEAVEVVYPTNNINIIAGTQFNPIASFRWAGGYDDKYPVPISLQIRNCDGDLLFYEAKATLNELRIDDGVKEYTFPVSDGNWSTDSFSPGCYRVAAIATMQFDGNRKNDTAYSEITILPANSVRTESTSEVLTLEANYPNPFIEKTTIRYLVSEDGYVNLSIRDINGKLIRKELEGSYCTKGLHSVIINREGTASGSYFCELTFKGRTGHVHSQTQILIVK